jgi:hypothetical protein
MLYPQPPSTSIPGNRARLAAGGATGPFETSGQAEQAGVKWIGMLSRQVEVALTGIVDALADGTFDDIDPDRYRDIPLRVTARAGNGPPDVAGDAVPG